MTSHLMPSVSIHRRLSLQGSTCGFVVLVQLLCAIQLECPDQATGGAVVGQVAAEPQPQPLTEAKALQ
jgi:hypothetical protein